MGQYIWNISLRFHNAYQCCQKWLMITTFGRFLASLIAQIQKQGNGGSDKRSQSVQNFECLPFYSSLTVIF